MRKSCVKKKMDPKLLEIRKRLLDDFEFYAKHCLRIRTKSGEIAPLVLNPPQRIFLDQLLKQYQAEGKVRMVVLKARQQGLSTIIGGFLYWWISQHKAQKGMVMTHKAESTKALFDMTKRYHDSVPEIVRPSTKYSSRKELSFDVLDSSYTVATAGGDGVGRGETFTQAHLSELAFWPTANAVENLNGLLQAIPNSKNSFVFIESTANGVSGPFYNMWRGAVEGKNGYIPVFIPWFKTPEYREPVPKTFKRTPEEKELVKKYGLDDEQLQFRRLKIAQNGIDLWMQEYPAYPDEAFLTSGRPVFDPKQLVVLKDKTRDVLRRLTLIGEEWEENVRGELTLYREIEPGETYYIGADVSMGIRGGDWSVAQVLDSKKRQVAVYRAHVHPDYYATVLYHMGMLFNEAHIVVESNSHGILTCTRLGKDMAYPNFYTEVSVDKLTDTETVKLGFHTNVKTKPLIIDQLRASMRMEEIELNDKVTITEMLTYVVNDNGSMEAEKGCFDDTVMALAMANHIHVGKFTPVEVTDDFYVEVI